jgi:hypothetical protein
MPIDENTLTGEVRAEISFARDKGLPVDRHVALALAIADLLELPDEVRFVPAVCKAMETPTRLDLPESIASTRAAAIKAGLD